MSVRVQERNIVQFHPLSSAQEMIHLDDVDRSMAKELETALVDKHMHRDPYALTSEVESSDFEIIHDHDYAKRPSSRWTECDSSSESTCIQIGENDRQACIQGVQEELCSNCGTLSSSRGKCFFCHGNREVETAQDKDGSPCKQDLRKSPSARTTPIVILSKDSVAFKKTNQASNNRTNKALIKAVESLSPEAFYSGKCATGSTISNLMSCNVRNVRPQNKLRRQTVVRKRTRSSLSKKAEPVVISIDSDSDDQGDSQAHTPKLEERSGTSSTEDRLTPPVVEPSNDKQKEPRKYRMRDQFGNIPQIPVVVRSDDHAVVLSSIMLRFGSLGICGPSSVEFHSDRFLFHLPAEYPVTYVHFDTKNMESCQYFLCRGMPTIILEATCHFARVIRERLRMVKGQAYFDPSSEIESEKRIIFRPTQDPLPKNAVQHLEAIFKRIASAMGCDKEKMFIKHSKAAISSFLGRCSPQRKNLTEDYLLRISSQQLSSNQRESMSVTHPDKTTPLVSEDPPSDDNITTSCTVSQSPVASSVKTDHVKAAESLSQDSPVDSTSNNQITTTNPSRPELILVYPPPPSKGGVVIHKVDLECLDEGEFLNDVIIDFYIKYLVSEVLSEEDRQKTYVFSSFFYGRLMRREYNHDKSPGDVPSSRMERRHQKVWKWTRNVDIFQKDFIIVPINEHSHWYVAIICYPGLVGASGNLHSPDVNGENMRNSATTSECSDNGKRSNDSDDVSQNDIISSKRTKLANERLSLTSNMMRLVVSTHDPDKSTQHTHDDQDSQTEQAPHRTRGTAFAHSRRVPIKRPCILVFDSLGGPPRRNVIQNIREYLTVERQTRKKSEHVYDAQTMKGFQPRVPQQNNFSDCGVFLLQYVQVFFEKPIMNFNIPIRGLETWFRDAEVKRKRSEIRDLIHELKRRRDENQR